MKNDQFNLLLKISGKCADSATAACRSVLVAGLKRSEAMQLHGVTQSQLSARLDDIAEVDATVRQLAKYYRTE